MHCSCCYSCCCFPFYHFSIVVVLSFLRFLKKYSIKEILIIKISEESLWLSFVIVTLAILLLKRWLSLWQATCPKVFSSSRHDLAKSLSKETTLPLDVVILLHEGHHIHSSPTLLLLFLLLLLLLLLFVQPSKALSSSLMLSLLLLLLSSTRKNIDEKCQ